ncbi:MAG: thermonuclease family protein [Rhizobiales bacterium]|nr:thermonuclease family protein [Hyphomicrobiales bacterium]
MPLLAALACALTFNLVLTASAAADCSGALLGQGRVAQVVDGRTLRLADGREIRLTGIMPPSDATTARAVLTALVANRDVVLRGDNDAPDRYGRQHALVVQAGTDTSVHTSVQVELLRAGAVLVTGTGLTTDCATELTAAETFAHQAGQGLWASPDVIKNAESPDDILAMLGRFALVEGKVLSARQSGATFYLNFGRHWVRDFAVIIPRQMIGSLARDGIDVKALAGRRVRVRGWIEQRGGPRIQLRGTGQIEVLDRR